MHSHRETHIHRQISSESTLSAIELSGEEDEEEEEEEEEQEEGASFRRRTEQFVPLQMVRF